MNESNSQDECRNCGTEYKGSFCPHCGQRQAIQPISLKGLGRELLHILNVEKKILHTFSSLTVRPGQTIREYIDGRRKPYISPFRYLLLVSAIAGALLFLFPVEELLVSEMEEDLKPDDLLSIRKNLFPAIGIIAVPLMTLFTSLLFLRNKRSFSEHVLANIYIAAHSFCFLLLVFPLYSISGNTTYHIMLSFAIVLISLAYYTWGFLGFIQPKQAVWASAKVAFSYILVYIILLSSLTFIIGVFVGVRGSLD